MIRLPTDLNNKWVQPNNSDKLGSVWYVENINFDEQGYAVQSPRAVAVMGDAVLPSGNGDFGFPLSVGKAGMGEFQVTTASDANFTVTMSDLQNSWDEDDGSSNPACTFDSNGAWWRGLWHVSTDTTVVSRPPTGGSSQAYTSRITGLTSGVRHIIKPFDSRVQLCVSNGNVVKQYDTSYANTVDLTISTDFEIVSMDYNNSMMAIATRLVNDGTYGQDQEARLFIWRGATTGANLDFGVGSDACMYVKAYKGSFVVLTRAGELLFFNGGGFDRLAAFPFFFTDKESGNSLTTNALGDSPFTVDGDVIYINVSLVLNEYGVKAEDRLENSPSGVWCYDPAVGLYHRYSPSISRAYVNSAATADVNTTTGVITVSAGTFGVETIPATGSIARLTSDAIGGLTLNHDYYIIKDSSTTFRLAETKDDAISGNHITLTSQPATRAYFWMYDLIDYGQTQFNNPGAIAKVGFDNPIYQDIIFGGRYKYTGLEAVDAICMTVPRLENRSYITSPKMFSDQVTDTAQKIFVKFRPLKSTDSILVKYRNKNLLGLPTVSGSFEAIWTGADDFYTTQDLSEAKTYVDRGDILEIKFTAGVGAGQAVKILSIDESGGTYNLVLEEDVLGAGSGLKSEYIITNWEVLRTITNDDNDDGFVEVTIDKGVSKFGQFQLELRGSEIAIEEAMFIKDINQEAV